MKLKKVLFLLMILAGVMWADTWTLDSEQAFWTNSQSENAYQDFKIKKVSGGYFLSDKDAEIVKAKLWMCKYWFYPDPYSCKLAKYILEYEYKLQENFYKRQKLEDRIKKQKKIIIIISPIFFISGGILGIILSNR